MERGKRRRGEPGFTLVELLVVIVILGILSGVVVFAVRGAGDKGEGAAVATDARTIRTALKTYCAKKGHYPTDPVKTPLQVLEDEKFLGSPSGYHTVETGDETNLAPPFQGNCPGTPKHYKIGCQAPGTTPPNCGTSNNTPEDPNHVHTDQTWRVHGEMAPPRREFSQIYGVYFTDELNGHLVGNRQGFARTTDGGNNWIIYRPANATSAALKDVSFFDESRGIAVGEGGFIFGTTGGGAGQSGSQETETGWLRRESPVTQTLHGVDFVTDVRAFAVGAGGTILTTDNGGFSWSEQDSPTTEDLRAVDFVSATHGYAVGHNGTMLATINGGQEWVTKTNFPGAGAGAPNLNGVSFVDSGQGHVVGDGIVLNTYDGGGTWQRPNAPTNFSSRAAPEEPQNFRSVSFADRNHGAAVAQRWTGGSDGDIWTTGDGGRTWVLSVRGTYRLHDVMFPRNLPRDRRGHRGYLGGGTNPPTQEPDQAPNDRPLGCCGGVFIRTSPPAPAEPL